MNLWTLKSSRLSSNLKNGDLLLLPETASQVATVYTRLTDRAGWAMMPRNLECVRLEKANNQSDAKSCKGVLECWSAGVLEC